jgi:hypothetical protein
LGAEDGAAVPLGFAVPRAAIELLRSAQWALPVRVPGIG